MATKARGNGFTLIELLVVIAIIAILAAILFPVFARAREKARQTTCVSNNKQLVLAMRMYSQDYDEHNVLGWQTPYTNKFNQPPARAWWQFGLPPYIKSVPLFACPDLLNPLFCGETQPCPAWMNGDSSYRFHSGIAINWYTPQGTDAGQWGLYCPNCGGAGISVFGGVIDSYVNAAAERIVLLEGNSVVAGPNPGMGFTYTAWRNAVYAGGDQGHDYGVPRHMGIMNCALYDGHVKAFNPMGIPEAYFDIQDCYQRTDRCWSWR